MSIRHHALDEKYTALDGQVLMSGIQALVRLPLLQQDRDRACGLNTAGYVTGYRGSPLGSVDQSMQKAAEHLRTHQVVFHPGINEDLAATAVWGSQQVNLFPEAKFDGVYAMWYGKGPGIDRSGDVLKHGNAAGSSRHGGVLIVAGDDHAAKSSTFPHQSDHALVAAMIPVLSPSGVQEVLDFGLHGWAMSRYSGCWVAIKAISDTIESSAVVDVSPQRIHIRLPPDFEMPEAGLNIRWPDPPLEQEKRLLHQRLYAALAYARANDLNRIVLNAPAARLGIITTGKSYLDVMQALDDLGIDNSLAGDIGLRIFKVGMVWPLEPEGVRRFAQGLEEILVVEEKRQIIEYQLKEQLYNWREDVRPRVVGKFAEKGEWALPHGDWLLPAAGELTPALIARAIADRLATAFDSPEIRDRLKFYRDKEAQLVQKRDRLLRVPHYCSGCPHNLSTRVPQGSRALAGIGCHYMALWIEPHTQTFSQMGGEGVAWIGQAPFSNTPHVFANLGDGTYFHSGLLAIRAAIAAKVNITYKILYNDAVAMTGGQAVDGQLDVARMTRQLHAEGVSKIFITSDNPQKYADRAQLAPGVAVFDRRELQSVQIQLRALPGTTVLIHEQTCAAEKRRRRKRGEIADPPRRTMINARVCEGCGDCSEKSGCLSILPLETALGRKRKIDQSSCNKDFSCLEGFCPSFVTIEGGVLRSAQRKPAAGAKLSAPPDPMPAALTLPYSIMVTGIGGTGVVTIGQVLAMAAHMDGLAVTVLDMAGLAQKGGSVWSHLRLAPTQAQLHAVRIADGDANLVLGCDLVVTASEEALSKMREGFSRVVVNNFEAPTSAFLTQPDLPFPASSMKHTLQQSVGADHFYEINATRLAIALLNDALATNMFMLGFAWQKGLVPISQEAIIAAIKLNGSAPEFNQQAFSWGRQAAYHPERVEALITTSSVVQFVPRETAEAVLHHRAQLLCAYQNQKLADRYRQLVMRVKQAEARLSPERLSLTLAVAKAYYQILAYKDEYEVARLYSDGEFISEVRGAFQGDYQIRFHLGASWLTRGRSLKLSLGPWALKAMRLLARLRFLRGTPFDPFALQLDRRLERHLINEYQELIEQLLQGLNRDNLAQAIDLANLALNIRGYGHIKAERYHQVQQQWQEGLPRFLALAGTRRVA